MIEVGPGEHPVRVLNNPVNWSLLNTRFDDTDHYVVNEGIEEMDVIFFDAEKAKTYAEMAERN